MSLTVSTLRGRLVDFDPVTSMVRSSWGHWSRSQLSKNNIGNTKKKRKIAKNFTIKTVDFCKLHKLAEGIYIFSLQFVPVRLSVNTIPTERFAHQLI